ncbi:hypothetical protein [Streptomyces avicenniae]|uniref:hypothetical protein n=1 Tax=Streptomyces avicenniae TaxID=500153 RepID=UPI00069C36D7|nr:hypothetical protein [Streptomyces avicenniae]
MSGTTTAVARLVTFVELDGAPTARQLSVSARLDAELADGRGLVLLGDRGWTMAGGPGLWTSLSAEDIERDARTVVGPDEPFDGRTHERMAADHWRALADTLGRHGVAVDGAGLARLPHDVVLGERLRARLATSR